MVKQTRRPSPSIFDLGEKVAQEIEAFPYLEILELRGNTLGVDATRPIARAVAKHPELKVC